MKRAALYSAAVLAVCCAWTASAQVSELQFDAAKVPRGTVLHYLKSQLDGTRATHVSVYVADQERLESLKWEPHAKAATLVTARMDWPRFSVRELRSWQLARGQVPALRGTLEAIQNGSRLKVSFVKGGTVPVSHWPWHSYDFDFASLAVTLPHLRDPQADFMFWRTDVIFVGEGTDFAEVGGIRMRFEAVELRNDQQLRRYSIGGAGFAHQYGRLWTDAQTGLLVEYQLPLGDEPGYDNVHLQLQRMEPMTPAQWEAFKRSRVES